MSHTAVDLSAGHLGGDQQAYKGVRYSTRLDVVSETSYWQPLLILVSGAPGSGKTTLAAEIALRLEVTHINRDDLANGLRLTVARGAPREIVARSIAAQFGSLELLLAMGVSLVSDGTMYAGEMEQSVRRLRDLAEVVNVHCWAEAAKTRFVERQRARGATDADFARWGEVLESYGDKIVQPLDLSCRRIDVRTDEGYDPSLDDLIAELAPDLAQRGAVRFLAQ